MRSVVSTKLDRLPDSCKPYQADAPRRRRNPWPAGASACGRALRHELVRERVVNQLGARAKLELFENPRPIGADRLDGQRELHADLGDLTARAAHAPPL